MGLMLHAGAEPVPYGELRHLPIPAATATHVPIAHQAVVDMVKYSLGFFGHEVVEEDYGVTPDGARFFGLLSLRSQYGDYTDTVGLRNSHDKKFPIGISFGSRVFVCDNLAFAGDHVIRRKHTANAKRDLPGLVAEVVEPLRDQRLLQAQVFDGYRRRRLEVHEVDAAIMQLYRREVINVTRIADVLEAYEKPPHDWGGETAWRLFNATTFALAGKVAENPASTRALHDVIDGYCPPVNTKQLALPHFA
ncbi:DUF932 domain-containing protein [Tsuneonella sp. HG222]